MRLSTELDRPASSIDPAIGFFVASQAYYAESLGFKWDENAEITHELRLLYRLRHAVAHGGGRKGAIRENDWRRLVKAAATGGDFSTDRASSSHRQASSIG